MAPSPSESARMNTAREARFRIDAPSSRPRVTRIIALDAASARMLPPLVRSASDRVRLWTWAGGDVSADPMLVAPDGSRAPLLEEVTSADLVVMVASAGESAEAAPAIGAACLSRGIMTTGVILAPPGRDVDASVALKNLRRHSAMLVVTSDEEYLTEMLSSLRA